MLIRTRREPDDPRRDFLLRLLSIGAFSTAPLILPAQVQAMGKLPRELPPGKSIYEIKGRVLVNGQAATEDTLIKPNDTVETGSGSRLVFVVGQDAFILRANSRLQMAGDDAGGLITTLRLLTGKILSVMGRRPPQATTVMRTTTATIGVRGTGVYLESEPGLSYVCTCYGLTSLQATGDPASREEITSQHHDAPRYITGDGPSGQRIRPAPFINHTDLELVLIEELVGRAPPFGVTGVDYSAPRRGY